MKRMCALMIGKCAATQNAADTELGSLGKGDCVEFCRHGAQIHLWVLHTGQT